MAALFKSGKSFDAGDHEDMADFEPIPVDWYEAEIVESDMKQNSKKNGNYLKLKYQITEGKYKGRYLFSNLNLDHPNEDAVAMAEKELATICRAIGIATVEDSEDLHKQTMLCKVTVKPKSATHPATNEIKGYKSLDGKPSNPASGDDDKPKKKKPAVSFED